eukprot:7944714-Ditylum_brightwellii.AAC.1
MGTGCRPIFVRTDHCSMFIVHFNHQTRAHPTPYATFRAAAPIAIPIPVSLICIERPNSL